MRLKINLPYVLIFLAGMLLLCLLAYPLGHDQALFSVGGRMIYETGAIPYRDFLDMKPPGIFYVYAIGNVINIEQAINIRLLDIFYHLICLSILYVFLRKIYESSLVASLSVFIYVLLYLSVGYWNTSGAESFALLPFIIILVSTHKLATSNDTTVLGGICLNISIGLSTFVLILLKFTFPIITVASVLCILKYSGSPLLRKILYLLIAILSIAAVASVYLVFLSKNGAMPDLLLTLKWLPKYADTAVVDRADSLGMLLYKDIPMSFINTFSLVFTIIIIVKAVSVLLNMDRSSSSPSRVVVLNKILFWFGLFAFVSVVLERKLFVYHYSRMFWIASPIIALWIVDNNDKISRLFKLRYKITAFCLAAAFIMFSPIPKIIYHTVRMVSSSIASDQSSIDSVLVKDGYDIISAKQVALRLDPATRDVRSDIFVWGNVVELYNLLHKLPSTFCVANPQFVSPWTPAEWKDKLLKQLTDSQPSYFIIEHNDARRSITGSTLDSYSSLKRWRELSLFIDQNYHFLDSNHSFLIYEHN